MSSSRIVEDLVFSYPGQLVFDRFTLESEDNPILLQGPSGSGKSTLLKLVAGFLAPNSATWVIQATSPVLVLQQGGLLPWLTGAQCLECVRSIGPQPQQTITALKELVAPLLPRRVFQMSFGQRRLVELYRALAFGGDLLCLDEPFNFLDPSKREVVAAAVAGLAAAGTRVLISSHYREDFNQFSGRIHSFTGELPIRTLSAVDR